MDPKNEIDDLERIADEAEADDSVSVEDFIKELEAKEKDLHITAETTLIEIAESFDEEVPDFLKNDLSFKTEKSIEAAASQPSPKTSVSSVGPTSEISGLKEKIAKLEAEREEMMLASQRRTRDFESFKARTERERGETFQTQVGNLATQMLPALDNLNRAVDFAEEHSGEQNSAFQQFLDGIVLVNQQVNEVLAGMGIQPIATLGEPFDPHYHEAVATEESDELPPNTISAELLRGYRIGDRVIRHSMVKVTKTPPKSDNASPESDLAEQKNSLAEKTDDNYLAANDSDLPAGDESELSDQSPAGDE